MGHIKIDGKCLSWEEVYNICDLVEEDFCSDPEGSYDTLLWQYRNETDFPQDNDCYEEDE